MDIIVHVIEIDVMDQYRHTLSPIINENKGKNKGENTIVHLVIVDKEMNFNCLIWSQCMYYITVLSE